MNILDRLEGWKLKLKENEQRGWTVISSKGSVWCGLLWQVDKDAFGITKHSKTLEGAVRLALREFAERTGS